MEVDRKRLSHENPLWIDPSREIYFITICCTPRHKNQLCRSETATRLFETVAYRNEKRIWFAHVFLLMPDHAHALLSFPRGLQSFTEVISLWKSWTAKRVGIVWQRDFFEHRLRSQENWRQKADYILQNPVRASMVKQAKEWPYVWFPSEPR